MSLPQSIIMCNFNIIIIETQRITSQGLESEPFGCLVLFCFVLFLSLIKNLHCLQGMLREVNFQFGKQIKGIPSDVCNTHSGWLQDYELDEQFSWRAGSLLHPGRSASRHNIF